MAELKPDKRVLVRLVALRFHGFKAVAELKPVRLSYSAAASSSFPRLQSRGRIEAWRIGVKWHNRPTGFHGFKAVAELKRHQALLERHQRHCFHGFKAVAELKPLHSKYQ